MAQNIYKRDGSLDLFRGLDVLLMMLVNLQGSDAAAFPLLKHAEWNGLTLADLVFPIFSLIVGLSAPLALDQEGSQPNWRQILRRVFILFMIGVVLGWLIKPSLHISDVRWTGVLQRIALVYLACAVVARARQGFWFAVVLASMLLFAHSLALLLITAPGETGPSLLPGAGVSPWLDQMLLPGRLHRVTWDPEGILSTVPSIATGLIGVAATRWIRQRSRTVDYTNTMICLWGTGLLVTGFTLTLILPLNKALGTASFSCVTAGTGFVVYAILRQFYSDSEGSRALVWLMGLGRAALTVYVIHMLLIVILVRKLSNGERLWAMLYRHLEYIIASPPLASIVFAIVATMASTLALPWLRRHGWLLKV